MISCAPTASVILVSSQSRAVLHLHPLAPHFTTSLSFVRTHRTDDVYLGNHYRAASPKPEQYYVDKEMMFALRSRTGDYRLPNRAQGIGGGGQGRPSSVFASLRGLSSGVVSRLALALYIL